MLFIEFSFYQFSSSLKPQDFLLNHIDVNALRVVGKSERKTWNLENLMEFNSASWNFVRNSVRVRKLIYKIVVLTFTHNAWLRCMLKSKSRIYHNVMSCKNKKIEMSSYEAHSLSIIINVRGNFLDPCIDHLSTAKNTLKYILPTSSHRFTFIFHFINGKYFFFFLSIYLSRINRKEMKIF